jgi:hypothetical protein
MTALFLDPSAELSRSARRGGDPLADAAVRRLLAQGPAAGDPLARVLALSDAGDREAKRFMADVARPLPADLHQRVSRGRTLLTRNAWLASVVETMGCSVRLCLAPSLLRAFPVPSRCPTPAAAPGVALLQLATDPDALIPHTPAWQALVRARLDQALRRASGDEMALFGQEGALTQLELAWAIAAWSHGMRSGLRRLGVPISADLAEAHHTLWTEIARMLGVPEWLRAPSAVGAAAHIATLQAALPAPDAPERTCAEQLLRGIASYPPCFASRAGVDALSRHLVGSELADTLGISAAGSWRAAWFVAVQSNLLATQDPTGHSAIRPS